MSKSLSIECQWLDQPSAADPVERKTWAALSVSAAGRFVTRLWDRATDSERHMIFVPAFPIARWLVVNWWALLHEPSLSERVPLAGVLPGERDWLGRHCLRAADSGLLLPRLYLYGSGRGVCAQWAADELDAYPSMPGSFIGGEWVHLDTFDAEQGLREFVVDVLARIGDMPDPRVARFRANWDAIAQADTDERGFCRAAGRMGLDPYGADGWPPGLLPLLETGLGGDPEKPLVEDFLESARGGMAVAQWGWAAGVEKALDLRATPRDVPNRLAIPSQHNPAKSGYAAARLVRDEIGAKADQPVTNVASVCEALHLGTLAFREFNHLPGSGIRAAVGWQAGRTPMLAGPIPSADTSRRFLEARGLYHAAYACDRGARLVTSAHAWDQQASRAFAAELLAPQTALLEYVTSAGDSEDHESVVRTLASRYAVSAWVIQHQLENAGVGGTD